MESKQSVGPRSITWGVRVVLSTFFQITLGSRGGGFVFTRSFDDALAGAGLDFGVDFTIGLEALPTDRGVMPGFTPSLGVTFTPPGVMVGRPGVTLAGVRVLRPGVTFTLAGVTVWRPGVPAPAGVPALAGDLASGVPPLPRILSITMAGVILAPRGESTYRAASGEFGF